MLQFEIFPCLADFLEFFAYYRLINVGTASAANSTVITTSEAEQILIRCKTNIDSMLSLFILEQNEFLSTRNATLSKKCESLCSENKKLASDHLLASSELADVKPKYEALLKEIKAVTELKDKRAAEARTAEETCKSIYCRSPLAL